MPLPADLMADIDTKLPARWSRNNPVDCAGGETRDTIPEVLEMITAHPDVHAVIYLGVGIQSNQARLIREGGFHPGYGLDRIVDYHERQDQRFAEAADELSRRYDKPILAATELAVADPTNPGPAAVRATGPAVLRQRQPGRGRLGASLSLRRVPSPPGSELMAGRRINPIVVLVVLAAIPALALGALWRFADARRPPPVVQPVAPDPATLPTPDDHAACCRCGAPQACCRVRSTSPRCRQPCNRCWRRSTTTGASRWRSTASRSSPRTIRSPCRRPAI